MNSPERAFFSTGGLFLRRFSYFLASLGFAALAAITLASPAAAVPFSPVAVNTDTARIDVAFPVDAEAVKAATAENRLTPAPVPLRTVKTARYVCVPFPVPGTIRAANGRVLAVPWARCYRRN
ncbi:hypothetical protein ACVI3U_002834 [Sinorhizobium medicae]